MVNQICTSNEVNSKNLIKISNKHSFSFSLSIFLCVYMVVYFYIKAIFIDEREVYQSYFSLLANLILFCVCSLNLFVFKKCKCGNFKSLFWSFGVFGLISYFVNFSGFEKLIGLCNILMCIMLFKFNPLKNYERKAVFCLFAFCVLLILINGTTDINSQDKTKFNPNGCGFLLSMLFCVCLVRFIRTRTFINLFIAVISLSLQFIFISRTAMLACLLFLLIAILFRVNKKVLKFKAVFFTIILLVIFGILFAYIYAEVLYPMWGHGKVKIFGKDLFTGREEIWHYTFLSIKENPIWGIGSHLNEDLVDSGFYTLIINAHNQPIGMLAAFGVMPFCLFYIAFAYAVAYEDNKNKSCYNLIPAVFMAITIIMSWFDLYLFSQYNWIAILIAYCLICSYSIRERKNRK